MSRVNLFTRPVTVQTVARRNGIDFAFMYLSVLGLGMFVAAFAWKRSWQPYIGVASAVLLMTWLAWLVSPRLGLKITIFLTLVGDKSTIPSFPFNKNLSSHESWLWISNGISLSPLELTLIVGLVSVAGRRWLQSLPLFSRGPLSKPLAILFAATWFGFAFGILRGGDLRAALFEMRPLLYFPIIYLITITVCEQTRHYRHLLYSAFAAITLQSIFSTRHALGLSSAQRGVLERLTEHGSSIGMNLVFVTLIASLAIRGCQWRMRTALLFASSCSVWVYLLSQRRVAFVSLVVAFMLLSIVLFWRQRRTFWLLVPALSFIGGIYVAAFWNSESAVGFPAQAVKTVLAPGELSAKDQSSDLYRIVENFNLRATIKSSPILGIGFGHPFLRPVPLADISVFEFNAFIPHNSVLWIWIKTGIVGFFSFLYMLAHTIVLGADRVRRQATGTDLVVSIAGLLFVIMFAIYMFADIAWEARNSMLFGICLALCTSGLGLDKLETKIDDDEEEETETIVLADTGSQGGGREAINLVAT